MFVGERRSPTAKRMKVRWEDGRLAAKQLFDAFDAIGFLKNSARFVNLYERGGFPAVRAAAEAGHAVIAMGKRVQKGLRVVGIPFTPLVHPAARGAVRKKEVYFEEVRRALTAAGVLPTTEERA
jgi:hypothetical protein